MIDWKKYHTKFSTMHDNGKYFTTEIWFDADPELLSLFMQTEYLGSVTVGADLCIEFPNQFPAPEFCACRISPVSKTEDGYTSNDWRDIELSREDIVALLDLVPSVGRNKTAI